MTVLNNIERISPPTANEFWARYVMPQKPVIIEGLFDTQPLHTVNSPERLAEVGGNVEVRVIQEYISLASKLAKEMRSGARQEVRDDRDPNDRWTFQRYLDHQKQDPKTRLIVTESPTAPELASLFTIPELCGPPETVASYMFLANRGNVSSLHFDSDNRQVLMFQLFGRKRFTLIRPDQGRKLNPLFLFSTLQPSEMSDSDRLAFMKYTDAYDCVLNPGDALFMPALIWHHVEYLDLSMGMNLRFGQNAYGHFFDRNVHSDHFMQNVAWMFVDAKRADAQYADEFAALKKVVSAVYPDPVTKYLAVREVLEGMYLRMCSPAGSIDYFARTMLGMDDIELHGAPIYRANYFRNFATGALD